MGSQKGGATEFMNVVALAAESKPVRSRLSRNPNFRQPTLQYSPLQPLLPA